MPSSDSADSPQQSGAAAFDINPVQVREAARMLRGALGEFHSNHDAVLRVLHQHPEFVRAIRALYDSEFSRTGQGLAADLKRFLDEPYIGIAEALLVRAGASAGQHAVTYVKQSTKEQSHSRHAIVANPAVKVAVHGTEVSYSVVKGAEIYSEGSYYAYQWLCLNDPQTSRMRGKPAVAWGPTGTSQWSARWDFPGNHKVLCRVQFREKNPGLLSGYTSHTPEYIEYQQTVQEQGDVLARELDKSPQREAPDEQLHQLQAYHQALRTAEEQRGSNKLDPQTQEALDHQIAKLREKLKSTEGRTRYPLKAVHITAENAQISQLNVFLARTAAGDGQETWTLVDITNPTDRRLTGEYCGTGKDAQHSVEQAVTEWERGNRYPKGRLRVKVPSAAGAELDQEFQTDGMNFWDSVGEFFSQVGFWAGMGMVGAAVLTTIAPDPAVSKAAAALLWASILAGSAGASINMIQRHAEGMSTLTEDAFDTLTIAGNILGARWALGATVKGLSLAGSRMGTALVIGRIGTDAAQGILLSAEYIREYQEILADPEPKRRTDKLVQLLAKAALSGGLLILSMRGSKADLEQRGAQNMKLGKLAKLSIWARRRPMEHHPPSRPQTSMQQILRKSRRPSTKPRRQASSPRLRLWRKRAVSQTPSSVSTIPSMPLGTQRRWAGASTMRSRLGEIFLAQCSIRPRSLALKGRPAGFNASTIPRIGYSSWRTHSWISFRSGSRLAYLLNKAKAHQRLHI